RPICFEQISYCDKCQTYVEAAKCRHGGSASLSISGTQVRDMVRKKQSLPTWFMREEVSSAILELQERGKEIFVPDEPSAPARVVWFTGLSGAGKSTIAERLRETLEAKGKKVRVFDGDDVRSRETAHLGFTPDDIRKNNRHMAELVKQSESEYDFILVPMISPFEESRQEAKKLFPGRFTQIFVDAPLEECKRRDPKGLYQRVEKGEIDNFIGVSPNVPFERPAQADLVVRSDAVSLDDAVNDILKELNP
ncbi:MAG: adenylyl-sulfate kinase, partial [Bdellovibrionales bacterium]|nr:adenylyl-sulfate kinase [Bdellovibrionales bacterium]